MRTIGKASVSSFLTILLNVAIYMVAFAMTLATAFMVVSFFWDFHGGELDIPVSFTVDSQALRVSAPALGVETAQLQDVRGSLKFPARETVPLVTPALFGVSLMLALILWALGQLRAVFRTLRDGQPFVPANATRIRRIAFAVMLGELMRTAFVFSANYYAASHFLATGLRFNAQPDLNVFAIIHGLIILVIAEVFRIGTRLAEDQSLTI